MELPLLGAAVAEGRVALVICCDTSSNRMHLNEAVTESFQNRIAIRNYKKGNLASERGVGSDAKHMQWIAVARLCVCMCLLLYVRVISVSGL